jgi:dipeptide/tripeptide permease
MPALALLPLIGVALNGTSSVLYGTVPELVRPERRARAFGIFYTGTIGGGALAPILFGAAGDAVGVVPSMIATAAMILLTLPLAWALAPWLSGGGATSPQPGIRRC